MAREIGNGEYEAKALNTCAIPYAVKGEYKEAFEYMKLALEKAEILDLRKVIASTLVNIGNIFRHCIIMKNLFGVIIGF
ncbi:MAG: hypothetical protein HC803_08560 [Saprospiraceae bacterium]|nr:hypothetical protein [Saprospiraceae bacterium]